MEGQLRILGVGGGHRGLQGAMSNILQDDHCRL